MSEPKRLSFAFELPSAVQGQIVQWRAGHLSGDAGRPIVADSLHLMLMLLDEVSAEKQRVLAALAGRLCQPGFILTLDNARQWLRLWAVWSGTRQPLRDLSQLTSILRAQATRSGCYQSPQSFHPHITLWRDACQAVPILAPGFYWLFPISELALCESNFGRGRTRHAALERYPFHKES